MSTLTTMEAKMKSKTGTAPVKKVGHTYSGAHGSTPNARRRGISQEPTDQSFGKGS